MPQPLQYRSGSLLYFQGDPAEKVFLLQTGAVSLVYQNIETGADIHDMVQPGEFFGIKSALGRFPREENALMLQDSTIMAFSTPEFEALTMKNTRIIMKILRVFSNQLRRIHKQVAVLTDSEAQNPEAGLFSVGDYYFKNKRYFLAKSVFNRYLTCHPSGKNAAQAAKNLEISETALGGSSGPVSVGEKAAPIPARSADAAKSYYDAVSLVSQEEYQTAYHIFKNIINNSQDPEYIAKSSFEIGRCLYLLDKFDDCIRHYTAVIAKYPRHPNLGDMLFDIGQVHEKCKRPAQAVVFYKKVAAMITDENNGTRIKALQALKPLEAD